VSLKVRCYARNAPHHKQFIGAACAGLRRLGLDAELRDWHKIEPSDVAVFWGARWHGRKAHTAAGGKCLILERGYIDRMHYASVGWHDSAGRADHAAEAAPPDRYSKLWRGKMRSWDRRETGIALIVGQVPGDATLGGGNIQAWAKDAAQHYLDAGYRVIWRPHPFARLGRGIFGELEPRVEVSTNENLDVDLKDAEVVVTYSSTAGVDSVMFGKRTVATSDYSIARPIADPGFGKGSIKDRFRWASELAYRQWNEREIALGEPFERLFAAIGEKVT